MPKMSVNDQILGNVGGEEDIAVGDVDNNVSEAMPTNAPDDSDFVDSDAEESDRITDPSIPPENGAHLLTTLPAELLRLITADMEPINLHCFRFTCISVRQQLDAPPLMSHGEYVQFHRQYEAHCPRRLRDLLCPFCHTFKNSTPSKTTFSDAHAAQSYNGRRACIECCIANGHYDKRNLVIKKKKFFVCGGCKLVLTHDKEEKVVQNVVFTKGYPYHDSGHGRATEITFDSGGRRWCKTCRVVIAGLEHSGTMKLKLLYLP